MLNGLEDVLKADSAKSTKVDCTQAVEEYIGKSDWRIFANANTGYSNAGLVNGLAGKVIANYWLDKVYTKKEGDAHRNGDYHIHDLDSLSGYCAGHDLARLLEEGFNGVTGRVGSKAPKHFREALYQMANFIGILQAEWAGAQAFSSFDTYLAPYAFFDTYYGSITYKDIKKAILNFIYNLNVPSRWGQCVPSTYKALKADGTWATCEDLQVGDEICVIDMETGKIKTDTVTHVNLYKAPEKLHQYQAMDIDRKHQFLVTPNHRVMHYDAEGFYLTESSKLLEANMLVRIPEASLVPFDMEEYVGKEYDITDDELELLSFILALGEFNKSFDRTSRRYKSIIRFKPDRWTLQFADRFKEVAARIGIPVTQSEKINAKSLKHSYPRFDLGSCPASKKLFDILQGSRKKPFPFANELSPRQAAIVVDTFCLLTNSSQTFGIWRIRCASKAVQQMLVNLSIKMGRRVVAERSKHDDPAWQNKFKNRKHKAFRAQSYFLQIYSNRPSTFKIREIDCIYKKVWCPTTNSGTFICMNEDGYVFFTGNSPFSNVTIDWTVPNDMKDQYPLRTGKHYFETIFDNIEFTEENKQNRINFFTELANRLELPVPDVDNREELINMCQQATYKIFHKEMTIIDKAFYECLNQGDINGLPFTFPIPTVNITEDFDWDGENTDILFENAAKYGSSYFQNFIGSQYKRDENGKLVKDEHAYSPNDVRSMCCRLQLDKRELRKRGGGLFGSDAQTGSIGVVTLNMARLGYLYKHNLPGLYKRLNQLLELAKSTLEKKRKFVQEMFLRGLYPYTKRYLRSFDTFFSTIGVNGMNEMVRNFTDDEYDITDPRGQEMCLTLLKNIREKLADFQEETGNLYNLEATPAEGTTYRLAKEDIKRYSDREVAYIECDKHGIVEVPMSELDKGEIECPKCLKEQQE